MNFMKDESAQKLRGGYYTPSDLAAFLARWVMEKSPNSILEPSCGDGVFFNAIAKSESPQKAKLLAFELNDEEAAKARVQAREEGLKTADVRCSDFLQWAIDHLGDGETCFDAVLGNPPFVRYQYLPEPFQIRAEKIFKSLNLPFTKHTNAWVPFVLASMALLRPGGRLAMVVPSEIIHVSHAQSLRTYLGHQCRRLVIVDPEELWFSDTLQGAVLLLAEKKNSLDEKTDGLGIHRVKTRDFARALPFTIFDAPRAMNGKTVEGKWTRAFLDTETRFLFDELSHNPDVHKFSDIAKVDVGIVTGANKFFLVPDSVVETHHLQRWALPMFGRSEHCPGVIYDEAQHAANAVKGNPTNFLWLRENSHKFCEQTKAYIKKGEQEKLHTRYKCRIRSPWYTVPSVHTTEVGMLKRSHDTPRPNSQLAWSVHDRHGISNTHTRCGGRKAGWLLHQPPYGVKRRVGRPPLWRGRAGARSD